MERGGQPGNQNGARAKRWREAILRALARLSAGKNLDAGLDEAAEKLVGLALTGDKWALDHLAERVDGKAAQSVTISGDEDNPIQTRQVVEFVHSEAPKDKRLNGHGEHSAPREA